MVVNTWLAEKTEKIVDGLSEIIILLKKFDAVLPVEFEAEVTEKIGAILYSVLKINASAFGNSRQWSPEDRDNIMANPDTNRISILNKYKKEFEESCLMSGGCPNCGGFGCNSCSD